ncbi:MAG: hypothetical protein J5895_00775 [Alphaproteobacteria bacterium]|nr:hypothetical protein [Alphaproteobacteria bacterium]
MIEIKENQTFLNIDIGSSCDVLANIEEKKKIDVIIGDAAKMDVQKAVNYIASGKAELTPLATRAESAAQSAESYANSAKDSAEEALSAAQSIISDKTFIFEQAVASDEWTITHNLKKHPSVTVVDTADNVIWPAVQYLDDNSCVARFNAATKGKAYLN